MASESGYGRCDAGTRPRHFDLRFGNQVSCRDSDQFGDFAVAVCKRFGRNIELLKHGDEQIRKRAIFVRDLLLPRFPATVPSPTLRIGARIVEILAMLESHVLAASQDQRVVA
mgnify:CR=1 FL=1